jgi:hypothetical protein
MTNCNGKTALVTGASRGIGRASALALAKEGAQVLVHYSRARMRRLKSLPRSAAGGRAEAVGADLSRAGWAAQACPQVREIVGDRLDILVANAGVSKAAPIEETTVEDFDRLFAVNVRAPFFLVQQLLPILHEGSSIVLLSSLAAHASVGTLPPMPRPRAPSTPCQAFRRRAWPARHPRQCGGPRRCPDGHVEFHKERSRARLHSRNAIPEAPRRTRRYRRRHRLSRFQPGALDHRRYVHVDGGSKL